MVTEEWTREEIERKRKMKQLRQRRRDIELLLCIALLIVAIIGSADSRKRQDGTQPDTEPDTVGQTEAAVPPTLPASDPVTDEVELYGVYEYPFNTMSQDWDGEDIAGFHYHEISEAAKASGGYFPPIAQIYTYIICNQYGVDYEMVFALIELESKCRYDAAGDDGNSVGYMQIQGQWHEDRMKRLGVDDLTNPFQNILVGVDILAEIQGQIIESGTAPEMVAADTLAVYNYGMQGARRYLWANGVHLYSYNQAILDRAEELRQEAAEGR